MYPHGYPIGGYVPVPYATASYSRGRSRHAPVVYPTQFPYMPTYHGATEHYPAQHWQRPHSHAHRPKQASSSAAVSPVANRGTPKAEQISPRFRTNAFTGSFVLKVPSRTELDTMANEESVEEQEAEVEPAPQNAEDEEGQPREQTIECPNEDLFVEDAAQEGNEDTQTSSVSSGSAAGSPEQPSRKRPFTVRDALLQIRLLAEEDRTESQEGATNQVPQPQQEDNEEVSLLRPGKRMRHMDMLLQMPEESTRSSQRKKTLMSLEEQLERIRQRKAVTLAMLQRLEEDEQRLLAEQRHIEDGLFADWQRSVIGEGPPEQPPSEPIVQEIVPVPAPPRVYPPKKTYSVEEIRQIRKDVCPIAYILVPDRNALSQLVDFSAASELSASAHEPPRVIASLTNCLRGQGILSATEQEKEEFVPLASDEEVDPIFHLFPSLDAVPLPPQFPVYSSLDPQLADTPLCKYEHNGECLDENCHALHKWQYERFLGTQSTEPVAFGPLELSQELRGLDWKAGTSSKRVAHILAKALSIDDNVQYVGLWIAYLDALYGNALAEVIAQVIQRALGQCENNFPLVRKAFELNRQLQDEALGKYLQEHYPTEVLIYSSYEELSLVESFSKFLDIFHASTTGDVRALKSLIWSFLVLLAKHVYQCNFPSRINIHQYPVVLPTFKYDKKLSETKTVRLILQQLIETVASVPCPEPYLQVLFCLHMQLFPPAPTRPGFAEDMLQGVLELRDSPQCWVAYLQARQADREAWESLYSKFFKPGQHIMLSVNDRRRVFFTSARSGPATRGHVARYKGISGYLFALAERALAKIGFCGNASSWSLLNKINV